MEMKTNVSPKTRNNWIMDAGLFLAMVVTVLSGIYFLVFPSGGYKGGSNPWYGIQVIFDREGWEWIHTWIGLGMVVIALVHILFHWKWFVSMTKRIVHGLFGKTSSLSRGGKYNLWLNFVTGLSFLVSAASGVYFIFAGGSEGGRNPDPMFLFTRTAWDVIHTWSSVLFVATFILHFAIHWLWIARVTRRVFGRVEKATAPQAAALVATEPNTINEKKENKMIKKLVGITLLVAVIGLLAFGAFTRTSETLASAQGVEDGYGRGYGNGNELPDADHDDVYEYGLGNGSGQGANDGYGNGEGELLLDTLPLGELSQAEKDALLYMREEEKLARDVYTAMAAEWDLPLFANIAESEQTHMDSVLDLLNRYEVTDPASSQPGVFTNPDLQALYDQLVKQGSVSLIEAVKVGGAIEEIDILDLQERIAQTDQEDIRVVFENLLQGSYNHLNAFSSTYEVQSGETYQPQYMTGEEYQAALDAGFAGGYGGGRGQGKGQGGGRR